jgi:hypothetical protein
MKPITIKQLEEAYVISERQKYQQIKLHHVKPLKAWRNKVVGRVVEQVVNHVGIPKDIVRDKGYKVPKFQTNEYTRLLQFYFEHQYGFSSKRISSEGRWRPEKNHPDGGRFIKGVNNGIEDIQVYLPNGVMIAVEVKGPTDRQRPDQIERQKQLGRAYVIATADFESFQIVFDATVKHFMPC